MARGARFSKRLRYWFDNTMSRGTASLIGWLAIVSMVMVVIVTIALEFAYPADERGRQPNPFLLLWQTFASTFSLDVPETGTLAVLGLWFILAVGGVFVVSALISLLTRGLHQQLEQLRKGRSVVVESDHTVILGWSDQVFTVVSELVEANRSRRRAAITILAEHDKVDMEDQLRRRLGNTGTTRIVCRTGSPLDLTDLELVNRTRPGRSSCWRRPPSTPRTPTRTYSRCCWPSTAARPSATTATTSWPRSATAATAPWRGWPAGTRSWSTPTTSAPGCSCRPRASPACRSSTRTCSTSAGTSST
ncbi:hypothetical protein ACFQX7_32265 [Luedemannella flava]